ncbi:MAG: hypothetical protein ACFFDN_16825 [Candidatus Hodarchaeota archaeon]
MKKILLTIIGIILFMCVILVLDYSSLLWQQFIGPKRENVRREIFEKTRSYNEAKIQDLVKYMHEYRLAKSNEDKEAIASTVRHMFANYNDKNLSLEMRQFLNQVKYGE